MKGLMTLLGNRISSSIPIRFIMGPCPILYLSFATLESMTGVDVSSALSGISLNYEKGKWIR